MPSGGTYSYYRREGHFLGVNRDLGACDLAVITCVEETGAPCCRDYGTLSPWPGRSGERLPDIRADPGWGRVTVRLAPGEAIILLGGLVPHALEPLAAGHVRVVSPLCFRVREGGQDRPQPTVERDEVPRDRAVSNRWSPSTRP